MTHLPSDDSEVEIGFLQRRRIEANIIEPIYRALCEEFGQEKAAEIIRNAVSQDARNSGAKFAEQMQEGPTIQAFVGIQELWRRGGALETTTVELNVDTFEFHVTRCRYAEMYREMGLAEIGGLLSCVRDAEFIAGFNPDISFSRSQTLMEGASHCDFRYSATSKN